MAAQVRRSFPLHGAPGDGPCHLHSSELPDPGGEQARAGPHWSRRLAAFWPQWKVGPEALVEFIHSFCSRGWDFKGLSCQGTSQPNFLPPSFSVLQLIARFNASRTKSQILIDDKTLLIHSF